ncbi:hypothetical protein K227x_59330 [Rubripirellula lacrimiformis]|uniref:Uncharacterized protein n=1 Tax=Rubripirellula lacrimiformis TaxID=1930273 RepID=A0A517NK51_9BACT|nr:hypothetical protein K227x_59330 [Rubripirellula lacrimiformis]
MGVGLSFAAIVISVIFGIVSTAISWDANRLASDSIVRSGQAVESANQNSERDRALQAKLAQIEYRSRIPRLEMLRFNRLSETSFFATVQNVGERQAAVFEVEYRMSDVKGAIGETLHTTAIIPVENADEPIKIEFTSGQVWVHQFRPPVVLAPGEIATFEMKPAANMPYGEFVLHFGINEHVHLGGFDTRTSTMDDPFGG